VAQTTAKQLLEEDISFVAGLIQEVIKSCKSEVQVNNYIDWIKSCNLCIFDAFDCAYSVSVVNSPKYLVYDIDWMGKAAERAACDHTSNWRDGFGPGRDDGGSIDVTKL
jgi:hypothetical protein